MKLTPYGLIAGLATIIGISMLTKKSYIIFIALILTVLLQPLICTNCLGNFSLSGFIGIFPLMLLLFIMDGNLLKSCLISLSLMMAIGRIGCYYAGCCTGKPCNSNTPFNIHYKKGSVVVDKYYKKNISVYPTIFLEIFLQFLLFYFIWVSEYGIPLFGLGNALLLYLTNMWRDQYRPNTWISISSLLFFSMLSFLKYKKTESKCCLKFKPDCLSILGGIFVTIVLSNDIFFV